MRIKKLDNRLKLCLNFIKNANIIADIGTDHAYLPINIINQNKAKKIYACDINPLPLKKARENINKYKMQDKIIPVLTNGLNGLEDKNLDTIIIAGMGAQIIIDIIKQAKFIKNSNINLILQPMKDAHLLRSFFIKQNFYIQKEQAIETKGKVYTVMLVNFGKINNLTPNFIFTGKLNYKTTNAEILDKYINMQIKHLSNMLNSPRNSNKDELLKQINNLKTFFNKGE